jgi:hypothetical protein
MGKDRREAARQLNAWREQEKGPDEPTVVAAPEPKLLPRYRNLL